MRDRVGCWSHQEADAQIRRGLPIAFVEYLQEVLDLTDAEAAQVIDRSRATYSRYRKASKELGVSEAERAVRYARLLALADETFGSIDQARRWMQETNYALGGERPVDVAETDPGAIMVRNVLLGARYGFAL